MSDIDRIPLGHRHSFWVVVIGKFILQTGQLSADENLRVLESLHSLCEKDALYGGYLSKEVLAMIEPASQAEFDIWNAASSLDTSDLKAESFAVLTDAETFDILVQLNPSILRAIHRANELKEGNKPGASGIPTPTATPSVAPAAVFEPKPDPYGHSLDPSFFQKPSAPRFAKGSAAHPGGEYNLWGV